jgi:hypothetical protein
MDQIKTDVKGLCVKWAAIAFVSATITSLLISLTSYSRPGFVYVVPSLWSWTLLNAAFGYTFADTHKWLLYLVAALTQGFILALMSILVCSTKKTSAKAASIIAIALIVAFVVCMVLPIGGAELP